MSQLDITSGVCLSPPPRPRFWLGWGMAALVLAAFWLFMVASVSDKCTTADEIVHHTAGYSYWMFNDYRLNPENGNLPQRLAALPAVLGSTHFPDREQGAWHASDGWELGYQFYYETGNDLGKLLLHGRMAVALLAVALGLVVYSWSRQLFGPAGAMLSLLLYVLNPTVLANGPLITSDMAGALFFMLSLWCLWRMLQRVTAGRVLVSGLAMGGLFVAKMSAPLIVPIAVALMVLRIVKDQPLEVKLPRRPAFLIPGRLKRCGVLAGTTLVILLLVVGTIWAFYGFSYPLLRAAGTNDSQCFSWDVLLNGGGPIVSSLQFFRAHRLLPEAYLYGYSHVFYFSQSRRAFLNGEIGIHGWKSFFPYAFLVKTPLPLFGVLVLAAAATIRRWRKRPEDATPPPTAEGDATPAADPCQPEESEHDCATRKTMWQSFDATAGLWLLMAAMWAVAITSHLDIGHRHILPVYPPLFVLAGAAAYWLANAKDVASPALRRFLALCPAVLVLLLAGETLYRYPNYLAYFNQVIGGPANGYKHLVDSSLDWGQDLPALKKYLDRHRSSGNVYLCYFGNGSPDYYGIVANALVGSASRKWHQLGWRGLFMPEPGAGTYCISATMYQAVLFTFPGPWNAEYERLYWHTQEELRRLAGTKQNSPERQALVKGKQEYWFRVRAAWDFLRTARLMAYLRSRTPDDLINDSILVFHVTEKELRQALEGPPAERLGRVQDGESLESLISSIPRE